MVSGVVDRDLCLTHIQKQVLLGTLLGDAYIEKRRVGNAYVGISQSVDHAEYVNWLYGILKSVSTKPPSVRTLKSKFGSHDVIGFTTRWAPCITELYNLMGPGRSITCEWLSEITDPIALAVWHMDDGSCSKTPNPKWNSYCVRNATGNREKHELDLLKAWIFDRFGISARIITSRSRETATEIDICRDEEVRKFESIVRPYIIPSMQYKLPPISRSTVRYRSPNKKGD